MKSNISKKEYVEFKLHYSRIVEVNKEKKYIILKLNKTFFGLFLQDCINELKNIFRED